MAGIPSFNEWFENAQFLGTPVIPKFYLEVDSLEERYIKLATHIKYLEDLINGGYSDQVAQNTKMIAELEQEFEEFKASGFDDYYKAQCEQWIKDHLTYIYTQVCKNVFFGLTSDGYFCAYIPESWQDIDFDTGAVYGTTEYGRLILRYDVDGQGVINNTNEPSESYAALVEEVARLSEIVDKNRAILKTPVNRKVN